ncbi:HTH-type transcriptional regulator MalT [subsurface metagenome]
MIQNLEERINTIQLPPSKPNPFETLTKSEFNVLELLIRGYSDQEIADIRYTSKNSVRIHKKRIYSKGGIPGKDPNNKCREATILYMIYHPKSFLDSYTKEELENAQLIDDLTPRELSVLEYYILGFFYKKIADKLKISKNTVRAHLRNIFHKLYIEEKDITRKNRKAVRLYILRYPEIIPSLYSQVKHFTANSGKCHSKKGIEKEIDIEPILSNITPSSDLTPRELEVLDGLIEGESNKELTNRLFISKNTLRSHIKNINEKWDIKWEGVGTREATRTARQQTYTKALEMRNNSKK